jgi:DnaJ-class molecular chaperone
MWRKIMVAERDNPDSVPPGTEGSGENVCRACRGTGKVEGKPCKECGGTGKIPTGIGGG